MKILREGCPRHFCLEHLSTQFCSALLHNFMIAWFYKISYLTLHFENYWCIYKIDSCPKLRFKKKTSDKLLDLVRRTEQNGDRDDFEDEYLVYCHE